jgi:antitoxin ParD1/3/4
VPATKECVFQLPVRQTEYIDSLVEAGEYASASEVVEAGLRALQERDASMEHWLREEVAPVYDAMQADPTRAISRDAVIAAIRSRHGPRRLKAKREP